MRAPTPIAFYAPLKSPDHPTPSGDRSVARLLLLALDEAGFAPALASRLRTYEPAGDRARQARIRDESWAEAERVAAVLARLDFHERPRLWFTYHSYYKAPDWLGPAVARRLAIPYVLAEATRALKRAEGPFALAHEGAEAALAAADVVFAVTAHDRQALERDRPPGQRLVDLPPFLDLRSWTGDRGSGEAATGRGGQPPRLLTVAMMREGDKLASYRELAAALAGIADRPWTLDIVGDGPARPAIEVAFAFAGDRARIHGLVADRLALARLYAGADLFVWPAVNEAYGMALLEAQAFGCPVVAGRRGGVASAVLPDRTAVLVPPGDVAAFGAAVASLLADPARRTRMAAAATRFVADERDLPRAAGVLRDALSDCLTRSGAGSCAS